MVPNAAPANITISTSERAFTNEKPDRTGRIITTGTKMINQAPMVATAVVTSQARSWKLRINPVRDFH